MDPLNDIISMLFSFFAAYWLHNMTLLANLNKQREFLIRFSLFFIC